jgi:hypothetical protein
MAAAPSYLTVAQFEALTVMPASYVGDIEAIQPGWSLTKLTSLSRLIDARLRKRYAVPFSAPYPETAQHWLSTIATPQFYLKRGVDPTDAQFAAMVEAATKAWSEVAEAANSDTGLFDLPLIADVAAPGGISKGAPLAYTETSPYVWRDIQREEGQAEDADFGG